MAEAPKRTTLVPGRDAVDRETEYVRADIANGYREALVKWDQWVMLALEMTDAERVIVDRAELIEMRTEFREALAKGDEDNG